MKQVIAPYRFFNDKKILNLVSEGWMTLNYPDS